MLALNSGHTICYVAAPYLIWLRHCELSFKVIWDSYVLMTATFIAVSWLLATDQSQFFHESASKPAPHLIASLCRHGGDAPGPGRTVADAMQLKHLAS